MPRERRFLYYAHDRSDLPDTFPKGFVYLSGRFINVYQMHCVTGLDYTYLYRVFRGERQPSLKYAERIARALEMELPDFLRDLERALRETATLEVEQS